MGVGRSQVVMPHSVGYLQNFISNIASFPK